LDDQPDFIVILDYQGQAVRLTNEHWEHILEHPEMTDQQERIKETLLAPDVVVATPTDSTVHAYVRLYLETPVTRKYLIVAVKVLEEDAFILTAHFANRMKRGQVIWQK
jgi:hypothetical protein